VAPDLQVSINELEASLIMNQRKPTVKTTAQGPARAHRGKAALLGACVLAQGTAWGATFSDDVTFLKSNLDLIVLSDRSGNAKVALAPSLQGRVMTSTAAGDAGISFGWINRSLIAAHQTQSHINVYGGEDRFWMGPEGGQFSIFFAKGAPFDLEHWFTPAAIDTEPFQVAQQNLTRAEFHHSFGLTNYSGTHFEVGVRRTVQLLDAKEAWTKLGVSARPEVKLVAYESVNVVRNVGQQPWLPQTGLLSIWILGMYNPSPATTIVVPIKAGSEADLGKLVTSDYFGSVPASRLAIKHDTIFFKGDGKFRSKIGINPKRSKGVLGSYDSVQKVLTLVQFTLPPGATNYVNSLWKIQRDPFAGDAANSYNDGPVSPGGKPLGPFYEMESSSPAATLAPGKSVEHTHRTIHLTGPEEGLNRISQAVLGVSLDEIKGALPPE
jgi:hypothetical protein